MTSLNALVKRNCKLFFKDKAMFFTSLITPAILLILYVTFLRKNFADSFTAAIPEMFSVDDSLIQGLVGGHLTSSLLAVCCVTVAFCSNLLMVQDKLTGAKKDLTMTPVKKSTMALGYFLATAMVTFLICLTAAVLCMGYLAVTGWYLRAVDIAALLLDTLLMVLFGTALSSMINYPLNTSGQSSAVGTIVSAGYGFICGAYLPISNFGEGIQKVLSYFPGTYGTSLLRNHSLNGVFAEMEHQGLPQELIQGFREATDCDLYFRGSLVGMPWKYAIVGITITAAVLVYILMNKKHE